MAVSYHDFRKDASGDDVLSTDVWIGHSHDGGATFPSERRVTSTSFDMRTAPDAGGYFGGHPGRGGPVCGYQFERD